jgi:hypothetical protein
MLYVLNYFCLNIEDWIGDLDSKYCFLIVKIDHYNDFRDKRQFLWRK